MTHAHRIEIRETNEHVRVTRNGVVLAETICPVVLTEGKLPMRYYIAPDDVRMELLQSSEETSHCPFKGDATYWSLPDEPNIAWTYRAPISGAEQIKGLVCFYNDKVEIELH
jgi:uncharacterized protein (DUF427 family)